MPKPRVLVVCTGNSARSQIAEGYMRSYLGDEFDIVSAGLDPKPLNPLAVQVMDEVGIDISQHYSKDLKSFLGQHFTYLITVCSNAESRCPIFPGVIYRLFWPFDVRLLSKARKQKNLPSSAKFVTRSILRYVIG